MSVAARLAALKAHRLARRAQPTPETASTSEDAHELVDSFQPVDGDEEAGEGETPAEPSAPAAAQGGAAVALPRAWRRRPVSEDAADRGARCRARRVGLGLGREAARALVGGGHDPASVLFRVEAGLRAPPGGWEVLEARLFECLELHVSRRLSQGERWQDIRVGGWGAADIRAAAESCAEAL